MNLPVEHGVSSTETGRSNASEGLLKEREARSLRLLVTIALLSFIVVTGYMVALIVMTGREAVQAPGLIAYFALCIAICVFHLALLRRRRWIAGVGLVTALLAAASPALLSWLLWSSIVPLPPVAVLSKLPVAAVGLSVIATMTLTLRPLYVVVVGIGVALTLEGFYQVAASDPKTILAIASTDPYVGPAVSRSRVVFELLFVATATASGAFAARVARQTVREAVELQRSTDQLSRYFSPGIAAGIRDGGEGFLRVGGREQDAVVLFSDIAGFTTMCASLGPAEVVKLLSGYQERMVTAIFEAGGTLDKFIGDGIMATFGTPRPAADAADRAMRAARGMMTALAQLNAERVARGEQPLSHRIGIHAGPVVVGNIGTSQRLEFTAIGDAVNVANRIEAACKKTGRAVMMSSAVVKQLSSTAEVEFLGEVTLEGQPRPLELYALR